MADFCRRFLECGAALLLASVACSAGSSALRPSQGQFDEERRRSDLSPIVLPGGGRVEFHTMASKALGGDQPFSVFLPPSFDRNPARTYPAVYFLHGLNNDETSWTVPRYGDLPAKLEEMIQAGTLPEIVMVNPRGDHSFYCNTADGSKRYEDYITQDIVEYVQAHYRARPERRYRSIGGTSMGGYGALKIAMKYPDRYAATVGLSPIIFLGKNPLDVPDEMKSSRFYGFFVSIFRPILGDPVSQDRWDANNPLLLARSGKLGDLKIMFAYGSADRYIQSIHLDEGAKALDRVLTEEHVPHTFRVYQGEPHGWALVAAHLQETMSFLCQTFK